MLNTLTRKERLNRKDFRGIKWEKHGETTHFVLLSSKNEQNLKKIGVSIRKKTGGAVLRNRMKRLVKEFFRLNKHIFTDCCNHLVRIKTIPQKMLWKDINSELHSLLNGNI